MRVFVTGSAGFIGHQYVKLLLEQGLEVVGIDNLNNYYDVRLKYARLKDLGINEFDDYELLQSKVYTNFIFKKLDVSDLDSLKNLFSEYKFDFIVHLAAQAGVRYSLENPKSYIESNVIGFFNILECCRSFVPRHLVYASSSSVYGNNKKIPFSEEDKVDSPVSLYAATKKSNELMAYTYSHLYKIPTTGLRFFTVYGPWGRPDMSPIIFARAIREGVPIKIYNYGDMERDFTYIDDILQGIYKAMYNYPKKGGELYYQLFNIGNSSPVKLMKFIELIERNMGQEAKKEMCPMQPGDVYRTFADVSKIQNLCDYKVNVSLNEGVKKFIDWYKNQDIV